MVIHCKGLRDVLGRKNSEWLNIPPLMHPTLGHVSLKQQTFQRSLGKAEMEWKCYLDKKKQGLIEPLVSPSYNVSSFFSFCLPPHPVPLTTLICFRLNLIRTRWIWLSFPASRLRNLASPPNHLFPHRLRSFMTPHRFCHSAVSGKERELPSQSLHFIKQTMEQRTQRAQKVTYSVF